MSNHAGFTTLLTCFMALVLLIFSTLLVLSTLLKAYIFPLRIFFVWEEDSTLDLKCQNAWDRRLLVGRGGKWAGWVIDGLGV